MEILRDTNIDFMRYRKPSVLASSVLVLIGIFAVFVHGKLNLGIDFAGGTQLTLQFQEHPQVDELRQILSSAGLSDVLIQRFGDEDRNEVIIKTATLEGSEEGSSGVVTRALDERYNAGAEGRFDLNRQGSEALATLLGSLDPEGLMAADPIAGADRYAEAAAAVVARRDETGLLASIDDLAGAPEVGQQVLQALRDNARVGSFAVVGAENVGPQIGAELRQKGLLAVVFSMIGMLAYIWIRFELRFGIGAIVATLHDVLITLGLFALAGFEFNLTTIAGFLTLVGYSVNDTVVVFDRVRENLRKSRREPLVEVMNRSLNQTLSRTILTSGTTLLAVGALLVLGGDVLRGFAFIMTIGVIIGTYSSIYVASPFALLWEEVFSRQRRTAHSARVSRSKDTGAATR